MQPEYQVSMTHVCTRSRAVLAELGAMLAMIYYKHGVFCSTDSGYARNDFLASLQKLGSALEIEKTHECRHCGLNGYCGRFPGSGLNSCGPRHDVIEVTMRVGIAWWMLKFHFSWPARNKGVLREDNTALLYS